MLTYKSRRWELSTTGFDNDLQLIGSDPAGGDAWTGLPIPAVGPNPLRATFLLSVAKFGIGERATLKGIRQLLEIGEYVGNGDAASYPLKRLVLTPNWRFSDGNVMWALRRIRPANNGFYNTLNTDGLQWRMGPSPTQLFEVIVGGAPQPPYMGLLPGEALEPNLTQFYDLRFPWNSDNASDTLNTPITGPCIVALFGSVLQTNPETRPVLAGTPGDFSTNSGITAEDAFVGNFPNSVYTRIAGSLILEQVEGGPPLKPGIEKLPTRAGLPESSRKENYDGRQ